MRESQVISANETPDELAIKLQKWFQDPLIRHCGWAPRLFWRVDDNGSPYGKFRVDPLELEVYFAALLGKPAAHAHRLEAIRPGRVAFLIANANRHELPLFTPMGH